MLTPEINTRYKVAIKTYCIGRRKSNYHTITETIVTPMHHAYSISVYIISVMGITQMNNFKSKLIWIVFVCAIRLEQSLRIINVFVVLKHHNIFTLIIFLIGFSLVRYLKMILNKRKYFSVFDSLWNVGKFINNKCIYLTASLYISPIGFSKHIIR